MKSVESRIFICLSSFIRHLHYTDSFQHFGGKKRRRKKNCLCHTVNMNRGFKIIVFTPIFFPGLEKKTRTKKKKRKKKWNHFAVIHLDAYTYIHAISSSSSICAISVVKEETIHR